MQNKDHHQSARAGQSDPRHMPVMATTVLEYLRPEPGESYLDLTAGYGGHAQKIIKATGAPKKAVLIDRDAEATAFLKEHFARSTILHQDFLGATASLKEASKRFDMILADLGVSSVHFNTPSRGFAFAHEGPLDMRMDAQQALTASQIVNDWPQAKLAAVLKELGEEPKARAIAATIVRQRPIARTTELASLVAKFWPKGKKHPATRVFQALRMAVNDELGQLAGTLPLLIDLLADDGRLVIISFHSLEDRLVKQFLAEASYGYEATLRLLTKKPATTADNEVAFNPRARSAKLRAAAKIKTKKG